MSWSKTLLHFFTDAFRPPFRTTHWIVLLYVVLSAVYNTDSHFNKWTLPDTDDYMRLNQMMAWVNGQSWFDLHIPHLYPQHIITMHWGRLPDLLLAGIFLTLKSVALFFKWEASQQAIAMLTAFIAPWFMLTGLLFLMREMARPTLGKNYAGLICFFVPLCTQMIFQFLPMRVDHHAYIILGAGAAFCALQAFALHIQPKRMMAIAGFALALALWNGAEIVPMLVLFCLALATLVILERKNFSFAALFGGVLLVASFLILLIAKAPGQRWVIEYDTFSFFYVLLGGMVAVYFVVLWGASLITRHRMLLTLFAIFAGLSGIALLLHFFPDFIYGPYAKANPQLETLFFPNIREAVPLYKSWTDLGEVFTSAPNQAVSGALFYLGTRMFISIAGILTALIMLFRKATPRRQKKLWALYAFFALGFSILTMAWQVRVVTYAQLFSVIPVVWLLLKAIAALPRYYHGRKLFAFEILTVFGMTLFPVVVMPAVLGQQRFMPDMLFYLGRGGDTPCGNRLAVISYLRDLAEREKKPSTIMAQMDYTPELMFYTPHNFIAAPYHRNDRGIIDMVNFFRSRPNETSGQQIAKRLDLDYVLICKASYFQGTLSRSPEIQTYTLTVNGNKMDYKPSVKDVEKASLGIRLTKGKAPAWLEKRDIPLDSEFALFQVKKNLLGTFKAPKKR